MRLLHFWHSHQAELVAMVRQHVGLVAFATLLATLIGVPLGMLAARRPRLGRPLGALASLVQTIPSLALFGFLLPLPLIGGVGASTALVALVLYGVLPVFRTTLSGLVGIDRALIDTATAMGLTDRERLFRIELPLALPSIVSGVRIATVVGVGTATIAAAVGAGGLGEYIFRGLSMVDPIVILAGAIPAAVLALVADGFLALVERMVRRERRLSLPRLAGIAVAPLAASLLVFPSTDGRPTLVVGSKNFTEQIILGELVAQTIERTTELAVTRKLNLGGTLICEQALRTGGIDLYVEYSGTALTAIFKEPVVLDRDRALDIVRERYAGTQRTVGPPLGFNNTFAMLIRGEVARRTGLRTLSEATPHARRWRAAFGYEFLERQDGFAGLSRRYGIVLAAPPRAMDLSLTYRALAAGEVDLIAGDATAGLIPALDLAVLEDDLRYFPPYDAIPVVRSETLRQHPSLQRALDTLARRIDENTMRRMNAAVDVDKRAPSEVVAEALARWLGK